MAILIVTVDAERFSIDGIEYFKNFMSFISGSTLQIVNVYDSKLVLLNFTSFSEIKVDGASFATVALLQSAIMPVLFNKQAPSAGLYPMYPYVQVNNALIRKTGAIGAVNPAALQPTDLVLFKEITNAGDPITLFGYTYDGGDENLEASYSLNNAIQ